jgi:hypothetical protein
MDGGGLVERRRKEDGKEVEEAVAEGSEPLEVEVVSWRWSWADGNGALIWYEQQIGLGISTGEAVAEISFDGILDVE